MKKRNANVLKTGVALALFCIVALSTYVSPWSFALFVLLSWSLFLTETDATVRWGVYATDRLRLERWVVGAGFVAMIIMRFVSLQWTAAVGLAAIVSDGAANIFGSWLGKRYIMREFSEYSPAKSWEGAIGGFVGGFVVFLATMFNQLETGDWFKIVLIGIAVTIAAIMGDLRQSHMKRELGIKDTGDSLPGHGGVSERFDSISTSYVVAAALLPFLLVRM